MLKENEIAPILLHGKSQQRRKAARWLRKCGSGRFEDDLLQALQDELQFKNRWENQYHMLMALGAIGSVKSLNLLWSLVDKDLAYMPLVAAGEAIARIQNDPAILAHAKELNCVPLLIGIIRAAAQPDLDTSLLKAAVTAAANIESNDAIYWGLAAAQRNRGLSADDLISKARASNEPFLIQAADAYEKHEPLEVARL